MTSAENGVDLKVHVDNYGQVASKGDSVLITYTKDGQQFELGRGTLPAGIKPFDGADILFKSINTLDKGVAYDFTVLIDPQNKSPIILKGKVTQLEKK